MAQREVCIFVYSLTSLRREGGGGEKGEEGNPTQSNIMLYYVELCIMSNAKANKNVQTTGNKKDQNNQNNCSNDKIDMLKR